MTSDCLKAMHFLLIAALAAGCRTSQALAIRESKRDKDK